MKQHQLDPGNQRDKLTRILDKIIYEPSSPRVWITSKRWTRAVFFLEDPASSFNSPSSPRLAPNLASSAVPRFQPLQAVATCSPHLVRSSAPPLVQDQRAALLCNWQCYEVLVNVVTKSLVCPQRFLATMPTTKCLFFPIALSRQPRYQQWLAPQCLIVPAPSSTTWKVALQCSRWLCLPLYLIQQGFGGFSLGNHHLLSGLSCCLQLVH